MIRTNHFAVLLSAGAVCGLYSTGASAQTAGNDVRCLIVSNMYSKSADARTKEDAVKTSYFYLGRLVGSIEQFQAAFAMQGRAVTPQNAGPTMRACVQAVSQKRAQVREIARQLGR